jgi:bacterioferritin
MKPLSPEIITSLQASLSAHLTAIEAYASQAAHFARWGYTKLAKRAGEDAEEERLHAANLLSRLESLDTAPAWTHANPQYPARDLPGILSANLSLEQGAAAIERDGITKARGAGDEITAELLTENLSGSEASIVEIEAMQGQISDMGLGQFLSTQI